MSCSCTSFFLNEDITAEILSRLPATEVVRVRCVCKQWLSLTSSPRFIHLHTARNPNPTTSGFFLSDSIYSAKYFPLNLTQPAVLLPDPSLSFLRLSSSDLAQITVHSSSNGLIICSVHKTMYYICNPTTKQLFEFPIPDVAPNFSLVFDPLKSLDYKIIAAGAQIHVYSSTTRTWKLSVDERALHELGGLKDHRSVYWNGALVWVGNSSLLLLSFDVGGEHMKRLPAIPDLNGRPAKYLGESEGKLQMIVWRRNAKPAVVFDIYEMDCVRSGWSLMQRVELDPLTDLCPELY